MTLQSHCLLTSIIKRPILVHNISQIKHAVKPLHVNFGLSKTSSIRLTRLDTFVPLQRTFISIKHNYSLRREEEKRKEKKLTLPTGIKKELRENIYTIPNLLTFGRLLAAPYIGYLILERDYNMALGLFALAGFTDMLDGYIARKYNMRTLLGTIIDPAADKALMTVMTVTLTMEGVIPLPLATVILGRDLGLVISAFYYRYISLPEPKTIARYFDGSIPSAEVKPTQISKVNTALQLLLMGCSLTTVTVNVPSAEAMTALQWIVGGTTVWSGASYLFSKDAVRILKK
ncbi:Putative CDP-diacylglycerol-glycerol-3-phosphate 3-phosphatidyltransferase [Rhizopus microsporus]|nr:Putative CDP-diacylglycerol-glycerol-3-phosphate 3-phosphatidyltransferase [Rhizopus microsporus]